MTPPSRWSRSASTAYGVAVYVGFLAVFVYFVGWIEGFGVPRDIDDGPTASTATAIVLDVVVLGVFTAQHSIMARPAFQRVWVRAVPRPIERVAISPSAGRGDGHEGNEFCICDGGEARHADR